jgi:hypothetical protein
MKYDYEWLGYALLLTCDHGEEGIDERLVQGEEASELHDQLDASDNPEDIISDYFLD